MRDIYIVTYNDIVVSAHTYKWEAIQWIAKSNWERPQLELFCVANDFEGDVYKKRTYISLKDGELGNRLNDVCIDLSHLIGEIKDV